MKFGMRKPSLNKINIFYEKIRKSQYGKEYIIK